MGLDKIKVLSQKTSGSLCFQAIRGVFYDNSVFTISWISSVGFKNDGWWRLSSLLAVIFLFSLDNIIKVAKICISI